MKPGTPLSFLTARAINPQHGGGSSRGGCSRTPGLDFRRQVISALVPGHVPDSRLAHGGEAIVRLPGNVAFDTRLSAPKPSATTIDPPFDCMMLRQDRPSRSSGAVR